MKKTKFLMPILGIGTVAATVAPIVTMTACNEKSDWKDIEVTPNPEQRNKQWLCELTWKKYDEEKHGTVNATLESKNEDFLVNTSATLQGAKLAFGIGTASGGEIEKTTTVKVEIKLTWVDPNTGVTNGTKTYTLNFKCAHTEGPSL